MAFNKVQLSLSKFPEVTKVPATNVFVDVTYIPAPDIVKPTPPIILEPVAASVKAPVSVEDFSSCILEEPADGVSTLIVNSFTSKVTTGDENKGYMFVGIVSIVKKDKRFRLGSNQRPTA